MMNKLIILNILAITCKTMFGYRADGKERRGEKCVNSITWRQKKFGLRWCQQIFEWTLTKQQPLNTPTRLTVIVVFTPKEVPIRRYSLIAKGYAVELSRELVLVLFWSFLSLQLSRIPGFSPRWAPRSPPMKTDKWGGKGGEGEGVWGGGGSGGRDWGSGETPKVKLEDFKEMPKNFP